MRLAWALLPLTIATLAACERPAAPRVHAAASAASALEAKTVPVPGAADDSMNALMHEAFRGWRGQPGEVSRLEVPGPDEAKTTLAVAARPTLVVTIDATHRALATIAYPSEASGENTASHAAQGAVGVYLFERRDGRWFKTRAQDAVVWNGSNGIVDEVKAVDLGPGHPALVVMGSMLAQGETDDWLDIVEVEPAGARVVLRDVHLHMDNLGGASSSCEDWVSGARIPTDEQLADKFESRCDDFSGKWRIEPASGSGRGDFIVAYASHRVQADAQTHLNVFVVAGSTVVYRYGTSGYTKRSGDPPPN